jgi:hypothetical protein
MHSYLDVKEIEERRLKEVPKPRAKPVPNEWRARSKNFGTTGTLVLCSSFGDDRLTWKSGRATLDNTEKLVGRMYRKFISEGDVTITLVALDGDTPSLTRPVRVNDPLYLMVPSSTPAPFDKVAMFQLWDETGFDVNFRGQSHKVWVRMSYARQETIPTDNTDRGQKDYGKDAGQNIGVSIVRARRELDLDRSWARGYDPTERWWGVEVDFPPELDEVFGVTNNKQAATIFSHMVNFAWELEAEPNETYLAFKEGLEEEEDPRVALLGIVNHIQLNLKNIRDKIKDQTKGKRGGMKRHIDTSVEDRATTKFKERAEGGHETDSDKETFGQKAKDALVKDLIAGKKYSESVAKEIAEAVEKRGRKVVFIEAASEMSAFFSIETKPGGLTEIIFNSEHPAYKPLLMALDDDTADATAADLIMRIGNASDILKMLFAAWARQEIEDMRNRERLKLMRQDWGRMARDFLTDGED